MITDYMEEIDIDDNGNVTCPECKGNTDTSEDFDTACYTEAYEHFFECVRENTIDQLEDINKDDYEIFDTDKNDPDYDDILHECAIYYASDFYSAYTRQPNKYMHICAVCEGEGVIDWVKYITKPWEE